MKKLLLVVDYQNDFVSGALGFKRAEELEEPIAKKIIEYRSAGNDVAFTLDTHGENYMDTREGAGLPIPHCIKGSDGWELYGRIKSLAEKSDKFFLKPCFGSAELFEYLKNSRYDEIELVGVVTNICVISNAVLAKTALPEAIISVDSACTASGDEALCEQALNVMRSMQINIT